MTADLAAGGRTFWIADGVGAVEARLAAAALERAGWAAAPPEEARLVWAEGAEVAALAAAGRIVARIPGVDVLRDRAVAVSAARQVRQRTAPDAAALAGLPDTFVLPEDEEPLAEARRGDPAGRWIQRPALTTAGDPQAPLEAHHEPELSGSWTAQPAREPHLVEGAPAYARTLAVVLSLDPCLVYALDGTLVAAPGGDRDSGADDPGAFLIVAPSGAPTAIARTLGTLAGEIVAGARETLLHRSRRAGAAGGRCFQVLGVTATLDAELRPWLLDVEPAPLERWELPAGAAEALLDGAVAALDAVGAPERIGALRRVIPDPEPLRTLAALALPRPDDLALAAELSGAPVAAPRLAPSPGVRQWFLDAELALHVPAAGELLAVNEPGAFVWAALAEGLDPDETAAELVEAVAEPEDELRRSVREVLAEWVEAGALERADLAPTAPALPDASQPALGLPFLRWNPDRVYRCLGVSVVVRAPNRELSAWIDRALAGLADSDPAEIAAVVEVSAVPGGGWEVGGTHRGPRRYPTPHQLPAAVRTAVLASAARTTVHPAFHGTALERDGSIAVVVGPLEPRAELIRTWIADGGRVLADDLVALDDDLAVLPAVAGLPSNPGYQWLDAPPLPWETQGAPLVDESRRLVSHRFAALTATSSHPARAGRLVVAGAAGEPRPISAGATLAVLLTQRVDRGSPVSERQAEALVRFVAGVPRRQAALDDPHALVAELRQPVRPVAAR
jgi:hypothetical protein